MALRRRLSTPLSEVSHQNPLAPSAYSAFYRIEAALRPALMGTTSPALGVVQ
jgi:hypothetical protein